MSAGQYLDLPALARATLTGVVAHFDAAAVELPERRVIAAGEPRSISWDCPAVVVACGGVLWGHGPGAGAGARQTGNPVSVGGRHAVFTVQIIRCIPESDGVTPPEVADLTTAGITFLTDAGLLSQALVEMCGRQGVFQRMGVAIAGGVEPVGPSGGLVAVEGNLTITAGALV